jgi:hypothetical protein
VAAYSNRGVAKTNKGDLRGAVADYDCAIALDPKNHELIARRDSIRRQMNQPSGSPLSRLFGLFKS